MAVSSATGLGGGSVSGGVTGRPFLTVEVVKFSANPQTNRQQTALSSCVNRLIALCLHLVGVSS
jgi:hypothetical protein